MFRFALCVSYLFVLCELMSKSSKAQSLTYLAVDSSRLQYARAVEQQANRQHDSLLLAEAWYLYGKVYVFAGDYRTSQAYFLKSLGIHERRGNSLELSRLYFRLSENERRFGRFTDALHYANLSLRVAQRIQSDKALIRAYGGLGLVYESNWRGPLPQQWVAFEQILACYKQEEYLCYKIKDTMGVAEASVHLGTLFANVKDPKAIPYLKKALYWFTLKNKEGVRVNALVLLASAYLNAARYELARRSLSDAEKLYNNRKLNEYDVRTVLESTFVRYYEATGQWKAAFERLGRLNALQRNQLIADRNGAVTRLNIEYETQKKEARLNAQNRELALRAANIRSQQRFTLALSVLFLIAVGISIVFFRLYRKNRRISRQNIELVKEQNHRVKNNLQVVSSLLSLQSKRLTDEAAKKAVEESRLRVQSMAILHQRLYDGDKLAEANIDEFIREVVRGVLQAYGYPAVQTKFSIDRITLSADKAIPLGLIVNELTTNACKYAFPDNENPEFRLRCYRENNKIHLTVTDNGPGLEGPGRTDARLEGTQLSDFGAENMPATLKTSFGMQLIQAQVEQLGGTYKFRSSTGLIATGVECIVAFKG